MIEQILIIVSVVLFLLVGFLAKNRKAKSIDSFSTSRNKLSWFVTAAGVSMTFVGGAALINMAALGYSFSWYTGGKIRGHTLISDLISSNRLFISSSLDIFDFIHVLESFYRGIVTLRLMEE